MAFLLPLLLVLAAVAFLGLMYAVVVSVAKADRAQAQLTRVNAEENRQAAQQARYASYGYVTPPAVRR